MFKHTNLLRTFSDSIHFGFHEQSIDYSTKEAPSAFDFNSSTPYRLQCSQQASSPLDRQIYPWEAVPSSPHLPLGGSPLDPSFIWEATPSSIHLKVIPLITQFVTENSTKEEIPSSLWKNHFFFFFQFNVDANNSHYRLPILVNYKNDSFFFFSFK